MMIKLHAIRGLMKYEIFGGKLHFSKTGEYTEIVKQENTTKIWLRFNSLQFLGGGENINDKSNLIHWWWLDRM